MGGDSGECMGSGRVGVGWGKVGVGWGGLCIKWVGCGGGYWVRVG